jgi:hypothetical protein
MAEQVEVIEMLEIVFAVEGHQRPFTAPITPKTTVVEFAKVAAQAGQIEGAVEVFLEDGEHPLLADLVLVGNLSERFAPLHVARPGLIKVFVEYNGRRVERAFRPSATIARITEWAIGKNELNLEGGPADYQLKHNGQVLSPDQHLGQVAGGHKTVELHLVFKVKPQG